jgi:hypothetical protein
MDERCESCRFFESLGEPTKANGKCRRYAPRPLGPVVFRHEAAFDNHHENAYVTWPTVWTDEWCGEFAPIPRVPLEDAARKTPAATERQEPHD